MQFMILAREKIQQISNILDDLSSENHTTVQVKRVLKVQQKRLRGMIRTVHLLRLFSELKKKKKKEDRIYPPSPETSI